MSHPSPHPSGETLAAYWLGELPEAEALALEQHLFGCAPCTTASARMAALPRALAFAVAEQVELTMCARDGTPLRPSRVVPFDAQAGTITIACRAFYLSDIPLEVTFHVEAIAAGTRRPVGTFDVDHIPPV